MNQTKYCEGCRMIKPINLFQKIITRQTYDIGCDADGYIHYMKETKNCIYCLERQFQANIRCRKRKFDNKTT